jgi:hypothetical protein
MADDYRCLSLLQTLPAHIQYVLLFTKVDKLTNIENHWWDTRLNNGLYIENNMILDSDNNNDNAFDDNNIDNNDKNGNGTNDFSKRIERKKPTRSSHFEDITRTVEREVNRHVHIRYIKQLQQLNIQSSSSLLTLLDTGMAIQCTHTYIIYL